MLQFSLFLLIAFIIGGKIFIALMKNKSFRGAYGEHNTWKTLSALSEYPIIRNPIYRNSKGETCEIDMILLHPTGIYVIENKQYSGWIFGKEDQFQWTQSLSKNNKFRFYNPIMQNRKHIETLKEILGIYNDIFYNTVIFNDGCELKNVSFHSDLIVNNRSKAVQQLKERMQTKNKFISKVDLDIFQKKLNDQAHFDKATRREHIQSVKQRQSKTKTV